MTQESSLEPPKPFENWSCFIECFVKEYEEQNKKVEYRYTDNIGKPLTEERLNELFIWKNGSVISKKKTKSIEENYPPNPPELNDWEARYLDHRQKGGQIWNIFYLHIVFPNEYPIFDQHVYRSMCKILSIPLKELTVQNGKDKLSEYSKYRKFHARLKEIVGDENRKIDKALHAFGKSIKKTKKQLDTK